MGGDMNFKQHTIACMVGPSGSGKSYLADKIKNQFNGRKVSIVRSDDLRREMLCDSNLSDVSPVMMSVSSQAFDLLFTKIDLFSSYPVNHDLIIVDTTGLSEEFRNNVQKIAKKNNYYFDLVVFDYKNVDDYYVHAKSEYITRQHVKKLRQGMSKLGKPDQKFKLTDLNFDSLNITLEEHSNNIAGNCLVIGDIHGCYNSLISLLTKAGISIGKIADNFKTVEATSDVRGNRSTSICDDFQILSDDIITDMGKYDHIVLVGDYVDKGPLDQQYLAISFIHNNLDKFKVVRGNHENFVLKYWAGDLNVEEKVLVNFNSADHNCEDFKNKVREIWDKSYDFIQHERFIVTHAPCTKIQLGKTGSSSIVAQRNFRHSQYRSEQGLKGHGSHEDLMNALSFLDEGERCYPLHIFGHLACDRIYGGKNWKCIDTGAVYGNFLTSLSFVENNRPEVISVKGEKYCDGQLLKLHIPKTFTLSDLNDQIYKQKLVKQMIRNDVRFISGTMSPAQAVKE